MISLLLLIIMVALMAVRVPVSIAIGIAVTIALLVGDFPLDVIPTMMVDGLDSFPLLAVPFFVLAGNLMNAGGITRRIFAFARALFGPIRGGLAQVNVAASMIFAGMSGGPSPIWQVWAPLKWRPCVKTDIRKTFQPL